MPQILIAEDEPEIAEATAVFARRRGYDVLTAGTGPQAVELAGRHRPEVILLDVMLPGLDGRDVMKRLNDLGVTDHAIVLFVTARDTQADRLLGLELGAVEYETKPVHYGRLFNKIDALLAKKERGEL